MPRTEETWMDGITTEMMEHICDNLCRHPDQLSAMELEDECAKCKMSRFVCDILNQYNKVNDFADSQCAKLMEQMHELKERDTAKRPEEVDYELGYFVCPSCRESICFIDGYAKEHKCCLNCGQRLDFGGLNEI